MTTLGNGFVLKKVFLLIFFFNIEITVDAGVLIIFGSYRALLYGGMKESQQTEIELKGTTLAAFEILLKYIYTGYMTLTNLKASWNCRMS